MEKAFSNSTYNGNKNVVLCIFFIGLLCLGLFIYRDYGVHWDEYNNQGAGTRWMTYIRDAFSEKGRPEIKVVNGYEFIHGSFFELFLTSVHQEILGLEDTRSVIFTRHLLTFLTFYVGVLFFYLLCGYFFDRWTESLIACCFLVIHPRIFSHSFFNSVDIPFLTFYIINIYTLIRFLERKTLIRCFLHALSCAILINIRVAGLIAAQCAYLFILIDALVVEKGDYRHLVRNIAVFSFFLIVFTVLFWPFLWPNPVGNFLTVLKLSKFKSYIFPHWSYNFVWIAVTTPIIYSFFFLIGLIFSIHGFIRNPRKFYIKNRSIVVAALFLFMPLVIPILYKTLLFDGWRHHYFVYPVFIIFSVVGLFRTRDLIQPMVNGVDGRILNFGMAVIIIISLTPACVFMIRNHPYQYVYGNILSGKDMERAKFQNALDYWGLSYRYALEYILEHNDQDKINIFVVNSPGRDNSMILKKSERERLHYVGKVKDADYFIGNYRLTKNQYIYPDKEEYYSIKIKGQNIIVAYKLMN